MSALDKVMGRFDPDKGLERARKRYEIEKINADSEILKVKMDLLRQLPISETESNSMTVTNSGYGNGGASRRKSWAKKWRSRSRSAKSDIEKNRKLLRERSRDLAMNSPLGAAAIGSVRTNCIGCGLMPKPKIDYEFLNLSKEEAEQLEKRIKKEFALWAESSLCDNNDQNNFYELQQIAFVDWLKNGEEFVLIKYDKQLPYMPYQLRLKLVEADRVCTENTWSGNYHGEEKKESNGNTVINGVEIDRAGKAVAYYISSRHPGERIGDRCEWTRVKKRGDKTGNPNILHIFNGERADQYRGVPFLAPVIQTMKQLTRYTDAEIMAAVINSMFTIFITTENGNDMGGFGGEEEVAIDETEQDGIASLSDPDSGEDEIGLGYGNVAELRTGEKVEAVESKHPNGNYDSFLSAMANQIGAALEIAPEVLLKRFSNNFSASKGALNETWKAFQMRRKWFVSDFCQEVYELWMSEAVSKERIHAPGFFNNPLIRKAYTRATWNGPAQGYLNPVQEVEAAIMRTEHGLSTHEDECASMTGSDFDENIRSLVGENRKLREVKGDPEEGKEKNNDQN